MSQRDTLLAQITTNLAAFAAFKVSTELPFVAGNIPLHVKNMRTVYVDEQQVEVTDLIKTLDKRDIAQTVTTITAYVTVDAKNKPTNTDAVLTAMQNAANAIAPVVDAETTTSTEIQEDMIIYSIEYRFLTI
jgi:hypothetical protein